MGFYNVALRTLAHRPSPVEWISPKSFCANMGFGRKNIVYQHIMLLAFCLLCGETNERRNGKGKGKGAVKGKGKGGAGEGKEGKGKGRRKRKGMEWKGAEGKGREGKEMKGKERKGKERQGKERTNTH